MTLAEFKLKAKWSPEGGLDSWSNYSGPDLSEYLQGPSRSRDSDILAESNFETALEILGGASETVTVERFGHWACGWFEVILVDIKDENAVLELFKIAKSLEDYPVLDDSDYSDREYEYQSNYAKEASSDLAEALVLHLGLPEEMKDDSEMIEFCISVNVECQRYYGNDACIDIYSMREPSDRDLERFANCARDCIQYVGKMSEVEAFILAVIGELK